MFYFIPQYSFSFHAKWGGSSESRRAQSAPPRNSEHFRSILHHLLTFLFRIANHMRTHTPSGELIHHPPARPAWGRPHTGRSLRKMRTLKYVTKYNSHRCKPSVPQHLQSPPSRFPSSYKSYGNHVLDTRPTPLPTKFFPALYVCSHGAGEENVQQLVGTGRLFASVGTRGGECPPQVSRGVATSRCRHMARRSMAAVPSPRGKGVWDRHLTLPGQGGKKYTTQ